jgi:adenine-specific DNA-methyltransferase
MSKEAVETISIHTQSPAQELLEKFSSLLPGVIQDGVLDIARLGELLGIPTAGVPDTKERFGLMWAGKAKAVEALQAPSMASLAPDEENSVDWDTARNVFIEGDNLEVLKLLQKSYNDKVDLIYIDPPYNTGNDFVYSDDFSDSVKRYLEVTNQIDAEGNRLVANSDVSGRKHSNWITMMYPRLMLARNLLTDDGAIFVSIDDNEISNLRLLMDEIFGPENFVGQFIWAAGRKNDSKFVSTSHEYIVAYSRSMTTLKSEVGEWRTRKEGLDEIYKQHQSLVKLNGNSYDEISKGLKEWFKALPDDNPSKRHKQYSLVDERGIYFADNISWPGGGGPKFKVFHPVTKKPCKTPSSGWRFTEERIAQMMSEDRIHFGVDETSVPCTKAYLVDREYEVPYSVFYQDGRAATKRLRTFLDGALFDNPKDEVVLQRIIEFASKKDAVVLDFFAGSGTTGHAVALQNERDGGTRRYILVNAPEATDEKSTARAEGFEKVSEITRLRLQKVVETIPSAVASGLRCFTLSPSSFVSAGELVEGGLPLLNEATLRKNASNDEIASEALLKQGVALDEPWVKKKYGKAPVVQAGRVAVVLAKEITHEIVDASLADESSSTVIFLEDGFAGRDEVKANAHFAFKQKNKTMKTI